MNDKTLPLRYRKSLLQSECLWENQQNHQNMKQNKAQHNLDTQTVKISTLLSGNVGKYEILTGKNVLLEKELSEKAATIKWFEYLNESTDK